MKRTRYQMLTGLLLCGLFGFSAAGFGAWKELEPVPKGRWGLAAAAVGDTVYAIAGQDDSPKISKVEVFDIARGKWAEGKEIPQGRVRHAAVPFKGKIMSLEEPSMGSLPWEASRNMTPKMTNGQTRQICQPQESLQWWSL